MAAQINQKRAVFVREYLIDRNGTRAAIAAGYAPRSASVTSCRLLRNAKVQAAVSQLTEERLERLEVTADAVIQELAKIAFANMKDYWSVRDDGSLYVDLSRVTAIQAAGLADLRIDEYESATGHIKRTRVKLGPKTRALELLGKHLRLWGEGKDGCPEGLAQRLAEARQRVLRGMSDAELDTKIKELQTEMDSRRPHFDIQFVNAPAE